MSEPKLKPLVIYHAGCWDGFCAAWVARKALGAIESVPAHYSTEPPDVTERDVYIVDFCYPSAVLRRMVDAANSLVVLDHHKTAQAELEASAVSHEFDISKSGARLTWEWFFGSGAISPWLVDYTEDRDLWRHALGGTQEINAALRSYPLDFDQWDRFAARPASDFIAEGAAIRRQERQIVETHLRHAREIELAGHRVMAVNATVLFSEIAGELAKGKPFGACYFDRFDGKRQWSLRSDDHGVDVSVIAKSFGGGGHARAAGFEAEQ
jgi:uncharacterized protein